MSYNKLERVYGHPNSCLRKIIMTGPITVLNKRPVESTVTERRFDRNVTPL